MKEKIVYDGSQSKLEDLKGESIYLPDEDFNYKENNLARSRGNPKPCPICGLVISNSYGLSCHLRRHNNIKPFECSECPASFIIQSELKKHILTHSNDRPFKCSVCPKSYKSRTNLKDHLNSHHINEYKCRHCDDKFRKVSQRRKHELKIHNTGGELRCSYCPKKFSEKKYRHEHEITAHGKKIAKKQRTSGTPLGLLSFRTKRFKNSNPNFNFFGCKICPERFKYKMDQMSHYQMKHKEHFHEVFKACEVCGKYLKKKLYSTHLNAHKGILPYECTVCKHRSARKGDLKTHMLVHSKENFHKCSKCEKTYKDKARVKLCEKKHLGVKDVQCHLCGKAFYMNFELTHHVNLYHKNHKCSMCKYETNNKSSFHHHLKLHKYESIESKTKRMCEKCGKFFYKLSNLKRHLQSHNKSIDKKFDHRNQTKNKMQECPYCNFQGPDQTFIIKHCKELHPEKVNRCKICPFTTLHIAYLERHVKSHVKSNTDELYIHSVTDRRFRKDCKARKPLIECFTCGFLCPDRENMIKHIKNHDEFLKRFTWFSDFPNNIDVSAVSLYRNKKNLQYKNEKEEWVRQNTKILKLNPYPNQHKEEKGMIDCAKSSDNHSISQEGQASHKVTSSYGKESFDEVSALQVHNKCFPKSFKLQYGIDNRKASDCKALNSPSIKIKYVPLKTYISKHAIVNSDKSANISKDSKPSFSLHSTENSLKSTQVKEENSMADVERLRKNIRNIDGRIFFALEDLKSMKHVNIETLVKLFEEKNSRI